SCCGVASPPKRPQWHSPRTWRRSVATWAWPARNQPRSNACCLLLFPIHQPLMVGIRREEPLAHAAGHRVQVVAVVSRCGGDDMVAAGNEDKIIVAGADRDIEAPTLPSPASGGG